VRASPGPSVETSRIDPGGERGRGPWLLIIASLALVVLAVLKPWDSRVGSPVEPLAALPPAASSPTPAPTPRTIDAEVAERCNRPFGWRISAIMTWREQVVRNQVVIKPLISSDVVSPLDPAIPVVPVFGDEVNAIGFCAPVVGALRPPDDVTVDIWAIDPSHEIGTNTPRLVEPSRPSGLGGLYVPAPDGRRDDGRPPWPAGRYVFHLAGPEAGGFDAWFAVEVNPDR
jgi:hypothetical protein